MKKLLLTLSLLLSVASLMAVPAMKGLWSTLRLADGTMVQAQLMGDEHLHFWQTADGVRLVAKDDYYVKADMAQLIQNSMARRRNLKSVLSRTPEQVKAGTHTCYSGKKRGIVIMMEFKDMKFQPNRKELYQDILNKENYRSDRFKGSVADYFKAQSYGKFELTFDIVGPYKSEQPYSYYGENDDDGYDLHPGDLIVEAVKAADPEVNFRDYDWDGDGNVDQVYVVYCGKGEANGGNRMTIWPHMWTLTEALNSSIMLDGVNIDTYACSNELNRNGGIEGIGNFCHEFSHCLGFADLYDTSYSGWFGMGEFDLMCSGNYNDGGFCPAGYTAYERWMAGWLEPIVLDHDGATVTDLPALSNKGDAFVIYNNAHPDEYYMLENRQKTGWDASLPGKGLMITHVDFDQEIWDQNSPNTKVKANDLSTGDYTKTNDHQRLTIFHADNSPKNIDQANDLYPYGSNNQLTDTSVPASTLYNNNSDGSKMMGKPVTFITQNADGTISFKFRGGGKNPVTAIRDINADQHNRPTFDLQGRHIDNVKQRGLYITGGKKYVK